MIKDYVNTMNEKFSLMANEIKTKTEEFIRKCDNPNEAEKLKCLSAYYRSILQGVKVFGKDLACYDFISLTESTDIVLEENPELKTKVAEVKKVINIPSKNDSNEEAVESGRLKVNVSDLSAPFEINPNALSEIRKKFAERREKMMANIINREKMGLSSDDIALNSNPDLKTEVAKVSTDEFVIPESISDRDIVLEENPDLKINVSDISEDDLIIPEIISDNDIVLDENPDLKIEVAEVSTDEFVIPESISDRDIVLEENPDLKTKVAEVSKDSDKEE